MSYNNILPGTPAGSNEDDFDIFSVEATELGPIPAGRYVAIAEGGGPKVAKTGTKGYELRFRILEGTYANRLVWKFCAFTAKAAGISQSFLKPLGFRSKADLERPVPPNRFVCELFVTIRPDSQGNDVKSLKFLRVESPTADPFAPAATGLADASPPAAVAPAPPPSPLPETGGSEGEGDSLFGPIGPADPLGGLRQ